MLPPLRIVHCFRSPIGGIFRHVRDLAEAQAAAGHQIGIVCDSSTGGEFEERLFGAISEYLALGVYRTRMQRHIGWGDLATGYRTYRIIKELQPDVLHGHGAKGGVYARMFGSLLRVSGSRVARLYSPHGGSLHYDEDRPTGKVFFGLERLMAHFSDHLLFVSGFERNAYRRKVGEPRVANSLVYNGLRATEFAAVGAVEDAADFLYVGMMRDLKGPDLFIDALAEVERQVQRMVTAEMVGDGDDLPKYKRQAEAVGLGSRIRFRQPMPAREAFGLGRTIVVPSRAEAMPYIVLEALAAGKSLVATSVGGIPEIFGERSQVLVSPDVLQLSQKMVVALLDPQRYASLMPPGADLRARFGGDVMAARIEEAYRLSLSPAAR